MSNQFYVDSSEANGTLFTDDQQNEVSVTFTASGTWNTGSKNDYGPEGKVGARNKNAAYPNNTLYALLAVNSNNEVVGEGASITLSLEANESVRFVVNDTHYPNNRGQLTVDWQANAPATRQLNAKEGSGTTNLSIHPSVGVARLGNSEEFFLAPEAIGGLPTEFNGTTPVSTFKDTTGLIKRQGQLFRVFDDSGNELLPGQGNVQSIEWTVHLANKKAAWYQYSELDGNLLYGDDNSYENREVELRNNSKVTFDDRQALIIDPGPRTVSGANQQIGFDEANVPSTYPHYHYPQFVGDFQGTAIETLGELRTDSEGRLIVFGGYGHAGGNEPLTSYGGSDTWHDDISDGPVYCTVTFDDGSTAELKAWVIVGSPDYAPELVNISTLSDTMFDVGVRHFNFVPEMCQDGVYNSEYEANYQRDILPILERMSRYQWVANVQAMTALTLALNTFDPTDNTDTSATNPRAKFFDYFRALNDKPQNGANPQGELFKSQKGNGGTPPTPPATYDFPMMPLNSGSNSVSNRNIVKFLALDETQYFLLGQWAAGKFNNNDIPTPYNVDPRDMASVGNCVGLPMCPGIEVTWSVQNPSIYESPYVILHHQGKDGYNTTGLTPSRDECEGGGCEPGDLTKRMACPWQADFFQCTIQYVNFTDPDVNKVDGEGAQKGEMVPKPPTYYAYWWPPQSPWDVLTGETSEKGQADSHLPAGIQVNYARGINNFVQMVEHWDALGFIRDQNAAQAGYPYFVETERTHELFSYKEARVASYSDNQEDWESTIPVFFIDKDRESVGGKSTRGAKLADYLEKRAFKPIKVAPGAHRTPRSGTRMRR